MCMRWLDKHKHTWRDDHILCISHKLVFLSKHRQCDVMTYFFFSVQGNEGRLYEFIVRHFLACVSQDALGQETVVDIDIAQEKFSTSGLMIIARNYLDVYPYDKWNTKVWSLFLIIDYALNILMFLFEHIQPLPVVRYVPVPLLCVCVPADSSVRARLPVPALCYRDGGRTDKSSAAAHWSWPNITDGEAWHWYSVNTHRWKLFFLCVWSQPLTNLANEHQEKKIDSHNLKFSFTTSPYCIFSHWHELISV